MKVGDVVQLTHDDTMLKSLSVVSRIPPPQAVGVIVSVYDGNLFEVRLFERPERTFLLFDVELVPCR